MSDDEEDMPGYAPPPSSFGDSQAPEVTPAVVQPAAQAPANPFWSAKGTGKKGGKKRKDVGGSSNDPMTNSLVVEGDESSGPTFVGISIRELEFARNRNQDGAESSVASEFEDGPSKRKSKKPKGATRGSAAEMMAGATFGGKKRVVDVEDSEKDGEEGEEGSDEESEGGDESIVQGLDSTIRGESCIGCLFDREVVGIIDEFVRRHCGSMSETALYRAASQHWNNQIVKPRAAEGVSVPKWHWKKISAHYNLHVVDPVLQRTNAVRELSKMREFQAQNLLRVNPDGTKSLDQKSAELMLKLVALSDRQIQALDAARMPPPPSRSR